MNSRKKYIKIIKIPEEQEGNSSEESLVKEITDTFSKLRSASNQIQEAQRVLVRRNSNKNIIRHI